MSRRERRNGLSLLEMMITLPTATVLIGAMSMCVTIMMRAKSQDDTLFRGSYDLSTAVTQIASDIESAVSLVSSSATHIEFVVPDRDGDRLPEQMRYEWGGSSGPNANKILWKYNQNPLSVLFDDVGDFNLQTSNTLASSPPPNHFRSEVAVLKSSDAFQNGIFREQVINSSNSIGQYIIPNTPPSARWDLGAISVMVCAADSNKDGVLCIRVTRANTASRLPIAPILAEVKLAEWRLGESYQWLEIPIAPISWQSPGTPLCITLTYAGGTGDVARVQFVENGVGMPSNTNLIRSINGGTSWTASDNSRDLRFYAYGFYNGYNSRRKFLSNVNLNLTSSRAGLQKIETSVRLPSGPEIP
ncbi:MAG: hypothetical protein NTW52_03515 [Planctomycetota bacterium]|nr:hypothetical protein [Planctomycetota bacterium]